MKINNRILTFLLVIVLMFNTSTLVSAKENITLPGYANFTFENPVILKAKGCQNILLEYETEDSLPRENTAMAIYIDNGLPGDGIRYGQTAWFSKMTYEGARKIPYVWPRIGTLRLKVCRNNWTEGIGKDKVNQLYNLEKQFHDKLKEMRDQRQQNGNGQHGGGKQGGRF